MELASYLVANLLNVGRDNVVGTVTCYGMNGPGIEIRWKRDFPRPSRTALGLTQPPIRWVLGISRG